MRRETQIHFKQAWCPSSFFWFYYILPAVLLEEDGCQGSGGDLFSLLVHYDSFCSVVSDSLRPHGLYTIGSSVHGNLQARILEWVVISFSRVSSLPTSSALQVDSLPSEPPGKLLIHRLLYIWSYCT